MTSSPSLWCILVFSSIKVRCYVELLTSLICRSRQAGLFPNLEESVTRIGVSDIPKRTISLFSIAKFFLSTSRNFLRLWIKAAKEVPARKGVQICVYKPLSLRIISFLSTIMDSYISDVFLILVVLVSIDILMAACCRTLSLLDYRYYSIGRYGRAFYSSVHRSIGIGWCRRWWV